MAAAALLGAVLCLGKLPTALSAEEGYDEYKVKGAILQRLTQFIEWPAEEGDGEREESVFRLVVLGNNPFGDVLPALFEKTRAQGVKVEIEETQQPSEAKDADMVFLCATPKRDWGKTCGELHAGGNALTVGEEKSFVEEGGMIALVLRESRIHFIINLDELRRHGYQVHTQLLSLAEVYEENGTEGES